MKNIKETSDIINKIRTSAVSKPFKKGDKVEIVGNIPFHLKNEPRPLIGTVTNVDGSYILVKPRYKRWEAEFYPNELKLIEKTKKNNFLTIKELDFMSYEEIMEHRVEVIKSYSGTKFGKSEEAIYCDEILNYCDVRFPEKYEKTLDELVKILHIKKDEEKKFKENLISYKKSSIKKFIFLK